MILFTTVLTLVLVMVRTMINAVCFYVCVKKRKLTADAAISNFYNENNDHYFLLQSSLHRNDDIDKQFDKRIGSFHRL